MAKVCVIGAGSWGLALSLVLNKNGHDVIVYSVLKDEIDMLISTRENKKCLPGLIIPESIKFTNDLSEATSYNDLWVMAVASPFTRKTSSSLKPYVTEGQKIVDVAKGIEESTLFTLSQVIKAELPQADVAVLSGPSHAEEVSRFIPTCCVVGAKTSETAEYIQNLFMNDAFRIYTSMDVLGIELGGSLKNVIALAAGVADGLGYGDNTKAALITRGIHEISRLGVAMGGNASTFYGLTGIGDLIVTCASMHSRNRRAGILIGQGKSVKEAQDEVKMVVEGIHCAKAAKILADKYQVSMPIINEVSEVLFNGKEAKDAIGSLMLRDKKMEINE